MVVEVFIAKEGELQWKKIQVDILATEG